jgi:hypothetical protein
MVFQGAMGSVLVRWNALKEIHITKLLQKYWLWLMNANYFSTVRRATTNQGIPE